VADQLILDGIHLREQALYLITSSPCPAFSSAYIPIPPELKVAYIPHSHNSPCYFPAKHFKPTLVRFPPQVSHSLEQCPTRIFCILYRWQRSEGLLKPEVVKVKSVNSGCRECNVTLCQDCFSLFHNIPSIPDHQDPTNHQTYSHSWVLSEEKG